MFNCLLVRCSCFVWSVVCLNVRFAYVSVRWRAYPVACSVACLFVLFGALACAFAWLLLNLGVVV